MYFADADEVENGADIPEPPSAVPASKSSLNVEVTVEVSHESHEDSRDDKGLGGSYVAIKDHVPKPARKKPKQVAPPMPNLQTVNYNLQRPRAQSPSPWSRWSRQIDIDKATGTGISREARIVQTPSFWRCCDYQYDSVDEKPAFKCSFLWSAWTFAGG